MTRLIDTFRIAAEESVRLDGEVMNLEISPRATRLSAVCFKLCSDRAVLVHFAVQLSRLIWRRTRVAPAIAVGCPFVLKPASRTPIGALIIGEITGRDRSARKVLFRSFPVSRDGADLFTTDERLKLLSFTGSPGVGWKLKAKAGKKPVVLELGGNAACIVDDDADLDDAVSRLIFGAFYQSGQSCIGVQADHRARQGLRRIAREARRRHKRRWFPAIPKTSRPSSAR